MLWKLYDTEAEWEAQDAIVKTGLDIPRGGCLEYAEKLQVANSESPDLGKYLMPCIEGGEWDATAYFTASELVPWDDDWFPPLNV